jgi:quinol monooxygenase YgiN
MSSKVKVIALFKAHDGRHEELRALLDGMVAPTREEAGNLAYDLWQEQADPARFVLDELYVDDAAVAAHRATPHYQDYTSRIGELAERTAVVLSPVRSG